jgi:hypothetical protein
MRNLETAATETYKSRLMAFVAVMVALDSAAFAATPLHLSVCTRYVHQHFI